MAWYRTGTITLTNGSKDVTGISTTFIRNVKSGFALVGPDFKVYEIDTITSDTTLALKTEYSGATASGITPQIFQTQGIIAELSAQVAELLSTFAGFRDAYENGELVGQGLEIKGEFDDPSELPADPAVGDAYIIGTELYVWTGEVDWAAVPFTGTNGKSAYEIAVEEGFVGTEAEWVASLEGPQGDSAYEVAVTEGFVGTEVEWLESLQGAGLVIKSIVDEPSDLPVDGVAGETYLVGFTSPYDLWIWDLVAEAYVNAGPVVSEISSDILDTKVDKVVGKGLSTEDFTSAEKTKLAGLNEHWRGTYTSLAALETAIPTGVEGDYALVDPGAGEDVTQYNWDTQDGWVLSSGGVVSSTDVVPEGSTNLYFTYDRVRATVLTGFSLLVSTAADASDTVVAAFGKLQKQINDILVALDLKAPLESPELTGVPTAPTAATATDTTQLATTEFVHNVVDEIPPAVNTLPYVLHVNSIDYACVIEDGNSGVMCGGVDITGDGYIELQGNAALAIV